VDACDGEYTDDSGRADDAEMLVPFPDRLSSSICFRTRRISLVMYCCRCRGLDSDVSDERGVTKGSIWVVCDGEDQTIGPGVSSISPVSAEARRVRRFRLRRRKNRIIRMAMIASTAITIPIIMPIGNDLLCEAY
jgi:hypothetical protein